MGIEGVGCAPMLISNMETYICPKYVSAPEKDQPYTYIGLGEAACYNTSLLTHDKLYGTRAWTLEDVLSKTNFLMYLSEPLISLPNISVWGFISGTTYTCISGPGKANSTSYWICQSNV